MSDKRTSAALIVVFAICGARANAQEKAPAPVPEPTPAPAPAPAPAPTPAPKPFEDVIKLWRANLSEDFVKRQIETGSTVYNLSADDIIRCRDSGLPESLIHTMIQTTKRKSEPEPAREAPKAPPAPPAAAAKPAPAPAPPQVPSLAAEASRKWEGMARRNSGIVLKSRWDVGTFEFKEETARWADAKDPGKNLLIPARQIAEHYLRCLKKTGGNECFEWGFKTKDQEYRFRDVAWEQGEDAKVQEIFEFMKAIYPSLVNSQIPVDSK